MRLDDPAVVRDEYADESRLAVRKAAHDSGEGPNARQVLIEAIAEAEPRRVIEVGPGEGEVAQRLRDELGCERHFVRVDRRDAAGRTMFPPAASRHSGSSTPR